MQLFEAHQDAEIENYHYLPAFGEAAQLLAILPSSSASSERVFSLLRHMFGDRSCRSLEDKIELAVMLAYNNRVI